MFNRRSYPLAEGTVEAWGVDVRSEDLRQLLLIPKYNSLAVQVIKYKNFVVSPFSARPRKSNRETLMTLPVSVPGSYWTLDLDSRHEYMIVDGLHAGEIIGKTAENAVYSLFYQKFVENDVGLSYLNRFAKRFADQYIRERIRKYTDREYRNSVVYELESCTAESAVEGQMLNRAAIRCARDESFRDAVAAIQEMQESAETLEHRLMAFVRTHTTPIDLAYARVLAAGENGDKYLTLIACQKLETDEPFAAAVNAITPFRLSTLRKFLKSNLTIPKWKLPTYEHQYEH